MFFFSRNSYVVDHLDGLTDIHNHLLPGLDDGAASIQDTKAMIALMRECNISRAITTPHIMEDYYGLDKDRIATGYKETIEQLDSGFRPFLSGFAAEYMMDHRFINMSCHRNLLLILDRYVLTELSYFQKTDFIPEVAFNLSNIDVIPILAHPERYVYLEKLEEFKKFKDMKFMFQLNLLSLSDHYGTAVQRKAYKLLEKGFYTFVGTDAHKVDHLTKLKEIKIPTKYTSAFKNLVASQLEKFEGLS